MRSARGWLDGHAPPLGSTSTLFESTAAAAAASPLLEPLCSGCFKFGNVLSLSPFKLDPKAEVICRGLDPTSASSPAVPHFRMLLRNHKSRASMGATADADALLGEYYMNDLLGEVPRRGELVQRLLEQSP